MECRCRRCLKNAADILVEKLAERGMTNFEMYDVEIVEAFFLIFGVDRVRFAL